MAIVQTDMNEKVKHHPDIFDSRRSFISHDAREILTRLSDSLILLILAHAEFYPDHPLCPSEHSTAALEHLFGEARSALGKFTYAEFVIRMKTVVLHHRLQMLGEIKAEKAGTSRVGRVANLSLFAESNLT